MLSSVELTFPIFTAVCISVVSIITMYNKALKILTCPIFLRKKTHAICKDLKVQKYHLAVSLSKPSVSIFESREHENSLSALLAPNVISISLISDLITRLHVWKSFVCRCIVNSVIFLSDIYLSHT